MSSWRQLFFLVIMSHHHHHLFYPLTFLVCVVVLLFFRLIAGSLELLQLNLIFFLTSSIPPVFLNLVSKSRLFPVHLCFGDVSQNTCWEKDYVWLNSGIKERIYVKSKLQNRMGHRWTGTAHLEVNTWKAWANYQASFKRKLT